MEFLLEDILGFVNLLTNTFGYIYELLDRNIAEIILDGFRFLHPLLRFFLSGYLK